MGIQPAARQFKLDFIPLIKERYMLACTMATLKQAPVQQLVSLVRGAHFRALIETEAGYAIDEPGESFDWMGRGVAQWWWLTENRWSLQSRLLKGLIYTCFTESRKADS